MMSFRQTFLISGLAVVLGACGGGYSGYVIPQETALKPWVEPDLSEFEEGGTIEAEDLEDYEDYEDEDADGADAGGVTEDNQPPAAVSPAPAPASSKAAKKSQK